MIRAYKYRIYPTEEQARLIRQNCGAARFVYNYALQRYLEQREQSEEPVYYSGYEASKAIRALKNTPDENGDFPYAWLGSVDSILIGCATAHLQEAFVNMSKMGTGFPKFKSRRHEGSYSTRYIRGNIWVNDSYIKLPKISPIRIRLHRPLDGSIKNVTVSYTSSGKYYVSVSQDIPDEKILDSNAGGEVGIDVGLKEFYSDSNGHVVDNPKFYTKAQKRLRRQQRRLSRKEQKHIIGYKTVGKRRVPIYDRPLNECKNYQKQRIKVAKIHEHVANQRKYFQDVESIKIARENSLVCMEHLNIQGMQKNSRLAKSISDAGWYLFKSKVAYKVQDHGGVLVSVDTFFPSSQLCSCCGYKNTDVKNLSVRKWTCPQCGAEHDRDVNAGKNILAQGKAMLGA